MQQATITITIDGNTYTLNPTDKASIKSLPIGDRQQLITLLEAIQLYEQERRASAREAEGRANAAAALAATKPEQEKPGSGDIDQLMAQLVMEEKKNRKSGLTQQGLYKWMGISVAVIILLILIF